jgi:ubiquinone/menaquinone biosynthesis C-methylase UbiE
MLSRILEPEVMDSEAEARDYDAMDHSHVNRVFVTDFLQVWNRRSPILDVGTGTAQIPIEFCKQSPEGELVAIDLAEHMLKVAQFNIQKSGFLSRIKLRKVSGRGMDFPNHHFPAIMSNSIIHHIPEPMTCFSEIMRVAVPGATIFIRDLLRPDDEASLKKLVELYAGNDNDHQRKMFDDSLHASLTLEAVREMVSQLGFGPQTVQQTSDRHWTWAVKGTSV